MTNDPIADMLTRLKNAATVHHPQVIMPASKLRVAIARILKDEGYLDRIEVTRERPQPSLKVWLRYDEQRNPVLNGARRVSKPGRRIYASTRDIPWVQHGLGVAIVSTTKGVMTGSRAKRERLGGEILCEVW
ncbi:MAG TPA: 30S ribosomal protein S8 [Anaerolineae bacterium]